MTPVEPTTLIGNPVVYAKDQPEYIPLPARKTDDGSVITEWTLTEEERDRIARGENIRLTLLTFNQPLQPIRLEITSEED